MILCGSAIDVLRDMPSKSIDCCVTSPPYYGLRDYGVSGQIGLENTPQEYVQRLVNVFREVRRVLKDDGTLWLNIGDSYAAQRGGTHQPAESLAGGHHGYTPEGDIVNRGRSDGYNPTRNASAIGLKHKDLIGIPWMVAFALREDGWYLRQDIIWHKPNPMPESVKDRCTKSHEYIFLLSKSQKYYFDSDAIKERAISTDARPSALIRAREKDYSTKDRLHPDAYMKKTHPIGGRKYGDSTDTHYRTASGNDWNPYKNLADKGQRTHSMHQRRANGEADIVYPQRNKRDVWSVTTKPFKGAHFATFPEDLIKPCILAGCKMGGLVLDPFFGSGTTGVVAQKFGRRYIGIELNPDYVEIAKKRNANVQTEMMLI